MTSKPPLPPWRAVARSLARYDASALRARVAAALTPVAKPASRRTKAPPDPRVDGQTRVIEVLTAECAPWYGAGGWHVGNETFGTCWCHAFAKAYATEPVAEGVRLATDWVITEVDHMVACLRAFEAHYAGVYLPTEPAARAVALEAAIDRVLDLVIAESNCSESWYYYAADGIVWLLEAQHIALTSALRQLVTNTAETVCSSWVAPSAQGRRTLSGDIALAAL